MITNSLIHKYQSGFLPGHSTVHHLIELIHHTCIALENHKINCQIFCDISKAFDRVWHRGLLLKLENYGITSDFLMWFQSYLCHRNQKVFVNEKFSLEKFISAGVPQGSVLGPLLFLIFINDISDDSHGMTRLFADDTSLSYSSLNIRDMQLLINTDLIRVSEWASRWLIRFNPQKTEVMLISNTHIEDTIELRMDNTVLDIVNTHKHLSVILSSNNKWSIRSVLEYASEVWDGCIQGDSDRLEQVQLHAARIITGLHVFAPLNSLYYETGWESLAERREKKKLTLMYRIVHNDAPTYLTDLLPNRIQDISSYNLRNNQDF